MKRATILCLLTALCLSLTACTPKSPSESAQPAPTKEIDVTTYYKNHNFPEEKLSDTEKKITAPAGSVLDEELTFI